MWQKKVGLSQDETSIYAGGGGERKFLCERERQKSWQKKEKHPFMIQLLLLLVKKSIFDPHVLVSSVDILKNPGLTPLLFPPHPFFFQFRFHSPPPPSIHQHTHTHNGHNRRGEKEEGRRRRRNCIITIVEESLSFFFPPLHPAKLL